MPCGAIKSATRARPNVAGHSAEVLRPGRFHRRSGRDDLACVLSLGGGPQMAQLAAGKLLRTLNAPLWLGEAEIYASPSVGIAVSGDGGRAESLLRGPRSACIAAPALAVTLRFTTQRRFPG